MSTFLVVPLHACGALYVCERKRERACAHTHMYICTCIDIHTHIDIYTHVCVERETCLQLYKHGDSCKCTYTNSYIHTYIHTCTHHNHTYIQIVNTYDDRSVVARWSCSVKVWTQTDKTQYPSWKMPWEGELVYMYLYLHYAHSCVCLYAYVVRMCVYIMYANACVCMSVHVCMYVRSLELWRARKAPSEYMYACKCICVHIYTHIYILCMYILYIYICMSVRYFYVRPWKYVCMYVCMYAHVLGLWQLREVSNVQNYIQGKQDISGYI